uniref:Histone H2A.Z-specific chaperone CHZ1 n=1 Tax=Chaetomium globosum (strain ATCC 6205 / CBS 148.51 / DSM 1962 / NBRC 6347 / NRRL 1970) TaxID=306901 RepID=CHZ1_CHAGB|nr:RecName: Full=Histone H2A.Z-specific chaperone CHZ1 [Chaetomium globosum CBS 148.51]
MSAQNSTDPMGATNPENGGATATDLKGKGRAPAAQEPVEDTSMAEDDDDDDDEEDPEEEPEAADDDNMEEIDLDNVIGRRTRGKVIDFANAAQENPADDDDEEDDDDFVEDDNKMDDSKMDED